MSAGRGSGRRPASCRLDPSQHVAARRQLRRGPHPDDAARWLRADHAARRRGPVRIDVSAAMARARGGRVRPADRDPHYGVRRRSGTARGELPNGSPTPAGRWRWCTASAPVATPARTGCSRWQRDAWGLAGRRDAAGQRGLAEAPGARLSAVAAAALVPLGLVAWLPSGPRATGWASAGGTPASLVTAAHAGIESEDESELVQGIDGRSEAQVRLTTGLMRVDVALAIPGHALGKLDIRSRVRRSAAAGCG